MQRKHAISMYVKVQFLIVLDSYFKPYQVPPLSNTKSSAEVFTSFRISVRVCCISVSLSGELNSDAYMSMVSKYL